MHVNSFNFFPQMLQYEKDLHNCQYTNGIGMLNFSIHTCLKYSLDTDFYSSQEITL